MCKSRTYSYWGIAAVLVLSFIGLGWGGPLVNAEDSVSELRVGTDDFNIGWTITRSANFRRPPRRLNVKRSMQAFGKEVIFYRIGGTQENGKISGSYEILPQLGPLKVYHSFDGAVQVGFEGTFAASFSTSTPIYAPPPIWAKVKPFFKVRVGLESKDLDEFRFYGQTCGGANFTGSTGVKMKSSWGEAELSLEGYLNTGQGLLLEKEIDFAKMLGGGSLLEDLKGKAELGITGRPVLCRKWLHGEVEGCPGKTLYYKWQDAKFKLTLFFKVEAGPITLTNIKVKLLEVVPAGLESDGKKHPVFANCGPNEDQPGLKEDDYPDDVKIQFEPLVYEDLFRSIAEQGDFLFPGNRQRYCTGLQDPEECKNNPDRNFYLGEAINFLLYKNNERVPVLPKKITKTYRQKKEQDEEEDPYASKPYQDTSNLTWNSLRQLLLAGMVKQTKWPGLQSEKYRGPTPYQHQGETGVWSEVAGHPGCDFHTSIPDDPDNMKNWDHMRWILKQLSVDVDFRWQKEKRRRVCGRYSCWWVYYWVYRSGSAVSDDKTFTKGKLHRNIQAFFGKAKQKIGSDNLQEHIMGLFLLGRGAHYLIDAAIPLQALYLEGFRWNKPKTVNLGKAQPFGSPPPDLKAEANKVYNQDQKKIIKKAIADHYNVSSYDQAKSEAKKYVSWVSKRARNHPIKFLAPPEMASEENDSRGPLTDAQFRKMIKIPAWNNALNKRNKLIGKHLSKLLRWAADGYFDYGNQSDADQQILEQFGSSNSK